MDLTDEQWELLEPLIPKPPRREDGREDPGETPEMSSTASSGYFAPEHPGKTSQDATLRIRPATAASRDGPKKESFRVSSKNWPKTSKNGER